MLGAGKEERVASNLQVVSQGKYIQETRKFRGGRSQW